MAAALFLSLLKEEAPGWQDWRVGSAGTWALDGEPVSRNSQEVLRRRGLDASRHRSRMVTQELLASYDLILTMEAGHKEALQVEFPALAGRVYLLSEVAGLSGPVADPYGRSVEEYEKTAQKLEQILVVGMPRIRSLAESGRKARAALF
jgi:protein-tyrosine-phosphatase